MSEADAFELVAIYTANTTSFLTVYISFTFAYLTVAYFVGKALSPYQAIFVSGLFVVAALSMAACSVAQVQVIERLMSATPSLLDSLTLWNPRFWAGMSITS